ncbi:MAG: hypothetical protein MR809_02860 [Rikenellaceae bacterium]|nr:hypothetical protein [Rikenellaceae bacterium]MDY4916658.1 hypothetical protein [Candidatus Cryptobacteroides sp.]
MKVTNIYKALVAILLAGIAAVSCEWVDKVISGETVASVGKVRLSRAELNKALPSGLLPEDSVRLAHQYINTWASEIIFLQVAENQLSKEELDVSAELDEYRKSLLKYRYEQRYVNERLDTIFTDSQIREYYNAHQDRFVLRVPVVRADFLCISPDSPYIDEFRENIASDDAQRMQYSDSLAYFSAIRYETFGGKWINLNDLALEFGIDYSELLTYKKGDWIEYEGGTGLLHLAFIKSFVPAGKIAPLEYATPLIKDILLSIRKKELVSALEDQLVEDAIQSGVFVQY